MAPLPKNVFDVLLQAAQDTPDKGLSIYPKGQTQAPPHRITYLQLLHEAIALSRLVRGIPGTGPETIVLLHLDDHQDNVLWFWATVAAGLVPAMSTPFTNDLEQRRKHLAHLKEMLKNPIVITRRRLAPDFAVTGGSMQIVTVEDLQKHGEDQMDDVPGNNGLVYSPSSATSKKSDDLFALMLTSGSTGHAKAVRLCHGQVITALFGKSRYHGTTSRDVFLNWIGMDHVANLTEVHLHAMILGADQVHVHALDLLAQPMLFVHLIDRHRASYTFAPNFFLASVRKALEAFFAMSSPDSSPNLSSLRSLISGGEANSTALASVLSDLFGRLGAQRHFLRPGFGMTETCAGSIYGTRCPTFDVAHGREFTSLGRCIPCMSMRVRRDGHGSGSLAANEVGVLEVKGGNVFGGYFNNHEATVSSFSSDGWFITGDLAFIDDGGNLHLVGREKETIIINGVKYFPHEIEGAIEDASIPGVTPSFTAVFPHRPENADSETLCIVYLPSYQVNDDVEARLHVRNAIRDVVMKHCMSRPYKIIPLERVFLPKTALGKLSRSKLRKAFESGVYWEAIELDEKLIALAQGSREVVVQPSTEKELVLQDIFSDVFGVPPAEIGIHTNVYNLGCSSVELFRLKWAIQGNPHFPNVIPVTTMISNPTIASLLSAMDTTRDSSISPTTQYNPVVVLRSGGNKAPLWLVHPGVGEVLVFLNLAKQITDRPIYALRARGFDGEPLFGSMDEMVSTYLRAMRRTQPQGPYAIAGYSYGGTVAFEMAKMLMQQDGPDAVPFLAVFDQPPHIKQRMRHGRDWVDVLLTLVRFFDLLPDADREANFRRAAATHPDLNGKSGVASVDEHERLVELLLQHMAVERLEEYGLDKERLARWTSLALNSHVIARDYEPSGRVPVLEVFYGDPIADVAPSKAEWLEEKLSRWADFVDDARFHEVQGHHYTLLAPENIDSFARSFVARLAGCGL
ncbi:hypothetical protein SMACR_09570 [Sordaria macrospora]|uniref:WGS project CABT00000000 data, contig 2.125 n=2 Tax=Sordaria macrospora TaxID=5147 RepID=F7WCE6_SORMK|nr:uncharacterized protein SMAC_09570 [Sordaria macrospora k-hell]KAA8622145.1 hypothetical protein SMACR_09570 [Sordaria macrospora]WPJ65077.1 hypothetical protein SMAC4_09570 [Sordaria macrospora]CCC14582.1 unnamed protein product [Sordaria macrospora k-hell]